VADEPLIRNRELTSPAFVRDLRAFFSQTVEVLTAIAQIGNGLDGFTGQSQTQELNLRFGVPVNRATGCLRIAEYLYRRVTNLELEVDEAADQIAVIATGVG
jgi:hypothetical protein